MTTGWLAICDRCGFKFHSIQLKKEWNGLMTCGECWEPRHPQDFVKAVKDEQAVPWTRPEAVDTFIPLCYIDGSSCYTAMGIAGCMIAGNQTYSAEWLYDLTASNRTTTTRPIFNEGYVVADYWAEDYA